MIPTAKEFLIIKNDRDFRLSKSGEYISDLLIEFAKLHCIEQAEVISENVEADFEPMGWLADHHLNDPFIAGEDYEIPVSRQSILNAYPLNLIK